MDSFEVNKILGAVLASLTFVVALSIFAEQLYKPKKPAQPGFTVAIQDTAPTGGAQTAVTPQAVDIAAVMAQADASRGQAAFRQCASCHTVDKGGRNGAGPNLWNTVGETKGHAQGFNYSAPMRQRQGAGERWDYEQLYRFLENPRGYMPGTTMSFAGVRRSGERADIIAYLRALADTPKPLP
jgi:cytochrome c